MQREGSNLAELLLSSFPYSVLNAAAFIKNLVNFRTNSFFRFGKRFFLFWKPVCLGEKGQILPLFLGIASFFFTFVKLKKFNGASLCETTAGRYNEVV